VFKTNRQKKYFWTKKTRLLRVLRRCIW